MIPRIVHPHGDRGDLGVLMLDVDGASHIVRWRSGEVDDARCIGRTWEVDAGEWTRLHHTRRPGVTVEQVLADHHEAAEAVAAALDGVV